MELTADELGQIERKLLWLSVWMIHNANHLRPKTDGMKVGAHQASCALLNPGLFLPPMQARPPRNLRVTDSQDFLKPLT